MRVAIVGSGIAAMACAQALIERGIRPTVLDAGEELDDERRARIERLASLDAAQWHAEDVEALKPRRTHGVRGLPPKLAFGSDYVYGRARAHSPFESSAGVIPPTYARGGYSTVWGASVLPITDADMRGWPIAATDLAPHFRAVLAGRPFAAQDDALSEMFPLYRDTPAALAPAPQAQPLLEALAAAAPALRADNIWGGRARLMVAGDGDHACIGCGLCLTGCPRGSIYGAGDDWTRWIAAGAVEYRPYTIVRAVSQERTGVRVHAGDASNEVFDRVFLAAGALNTTRILLRSHALFDRAAILKDSQKFLLPFVLRHRARAGRAEPGTVLASAFVEMRDGQDGHWTHFQFSPHGEFVERSLGLGRGRLASIARAALAPIFERTMYAWGSLHSDISGTLSVTLAKRGDAEPTLVVRSHPNRHSRAAVRTAVRQLSRHRHALGGAPVPAFMRLSPVGGTGHFGGSLPMVAGAPGELQCDILGRPWGFQDLHCVDASVLPAIPATTLALTVMANAHRIATAAAGRP